MRSLSRFHRDGEALREPEDGDYVRHIPHDINGATSAVRIFERVLSDEFRDVGAEEFGHIGFETVLEEDFVQKVGAWIVPSCIVPADHKVVVICAVVDGFLVHDMEVLAVFEDGFAACVGVDANYFHVACGTLQVVEIKDFVVLKDFLDGWRGVKRKEDVGRCSGP